MANGPIEAKVKAATLAAFVVGLVVSTLNQTQADSQLLGSLPAWLQFVLTVAVPPVVTFLSGWKARHTPKTDPGLLPPRD
jgi:hypothetical protein